MTHLLRREESVTTDSLPDALGTDPRRAARLLLTAAEDEVEAQAMLGQILLDGRGIEADPALALTWFRIAAARGHAMASNMAGRCLELGWGCERNLPQAAHYYRQAAERGLDWGCYNYANLLATGRGVSCDEAEAYRLYHRAAQAGHAKSMNLVGRCLEDGRGVSADPDAARDWYRRSAIAGDFRGQFSHAVSLLNEGKTEEAEYWLLQALKHGNLKFLRVAGSTLLAAADRRLMPIALAYRTRAAELGDDSDRQAERAALAYLHRIGGAVEEANA
ncbi:sel1 repeat family protein [Stutzerimonas urumqiensis]|uniref:tetratricopeptide repeat protein n=1 Tax=Stutzerimonas urumqiensis TaxID=638269 RepID=UPI003BAB6C3B